MRKSITYSLVTLFMTVGLASCENRSAPVPLVIKNVTVIDGSGAAAKANQTLVISGNRITDVGPVGEIDVPKRAVVVDASGKFAIPGLWDMHVHLSKTKAEALPVLVANGVTSVRDMGGDWQEVQEMKRQIASGTVVGPRIKSPGPMLESPATIERIQEQGLHEDYHRTRVVVPDSASAAAIVDSIIALGVDFIKIREYASDAAYAAVAREARERGVMLAGHAPYSMDPVRAAGLGLATIEHASYPYPLTKDPEERARILDAFVENDVAIVPTIAAWRTNVMYPDSLSALIDDSLAVRDPRRRLISDYLVSAWREDVAHMPSKNLDWLLGYNGFIVHMCEDLKAMHEAGVTMMPGSDLAGPALFPGYSLHDELAYMVHNIGLSPMEVLESATRLPAELFDMADSLGTLGPGKLADVVLLDSNPLEDIDNTRRIFAVVRDGQYLPSESITQLLHGLTPETTGGFMLWPPEIATLGRAN